MEDAQPKVSKRGGARKKSGPSKSFVRLEIGARHLEQLKEWCKLRREMDFNRVTPEQFLTTLCKDRIDSPSFLKEIERMKVEKEVRAKARDTDAA